MDIDRLTDVFAKLVADLPAEDTRPFSDNEAVTRLRLIDPVLRDVLGWFPGETWVEIHAGEDRLDYALFDDDGVCWIVVEAKKRTTQLVDPLITGRGAEQLKLSGPVLGKTVWPIVDKQMSSYLGRYNPEIGIVTNGDQWIGFLARSLPPGVDRGESVAAVFRSTAEVADDLERFVAYFSRNGLRERYLQRILAPESHRGVIEVDPRRRAVEERQALSFQDRERAFYDVLDAAMREAFRPVKDDPLALETCFVESRESRAADERLARLARELQEFLADASEYPDAVRRELDADRKRESLPAHDAMVGTGLLSRLIGVPSAGKSTFLRRLYNLSLAGASDRFLLVWVDCNTVAPTFETLAAEALRVAEAAVFGEEGPSWELFRQVYHLEWAKQCRLLDISDNDTEERRAFVAERQRFETEHPAQALSALLRFVVRNRRRLPIVVLDGADDEATARAACRWAIAVHANAYAITTVAVDDTALWRLTRPDPMQREGAMEFWLPRPKVRDVLERRCAYLRERLSEVGVERGERVPVPVGRSVFVWEAEPDAVVKAISTILLEDPDVSTWIGELCNFDMTSILEVCREVVLSPHVRAEDLLKSQSTGVTPSRYRILKALIAPASHQFDPRTSTRVTNVFAHTHDDRALAPLLPIRLLAWLREREDQARDAGRPDPGFVEVRLLEDLFASHVHTPHQVTRSALRELLRLQLVETYDPSTTRFRPTTRLKVTRRGRLHLVWATEESTYVRLMAETSVVSNADVQAELRVAWQRFVDAARSSDTEGAKDAEAVLVALYVGDVVRQAERVARVSGHSSVAVLVELERSLRQRWVAATD